MPDSLVLKRATGLRSDPVTNKVYHLTDQPPPISVIIQKRLIVKQSDCEPFISRRLKLYRHHLTGVRDMVSGAYRRFFSNVGFSTIEAETIKEVITHVGLRPRSQCPREYKVVVAGYPGSGRSLACESISQTFGPVHGNDI